MYLSVIIPAYNEVKRIADTLASVNDYLTKQDYIYEVIVVNDGSKDKTSEVVKTVEQGMKHLKLIDNKKNHGKGWVVRQGIMEARGRYRLFMDADNSTTIDHLDKMMPYFNQGYDVVIGSIAVKGKKVAEGSEPFWRILFG